MTNNITNKNDLIILTAGGSGGHLYPADSLAAIIKNDYNLELVTDKRGIKNYKGELSQITNHSVYAGSIKGRSPLFILKSLFKLFIGTLQSITLLLNKKPKLVIAFGGYACIPCSIAAIILRIPLIIHEQNTVMGRANRSIAKYATLITKSFKNVKFLPKNVSTVYTGLPVRKEIIQLHNKPYPKLTKTGKIQILIMGGSQGAKILSDIIPETICSLDKTLQKRLEIHQQSRAEDVERVKAAYKESDAKVTINSFFTNIPELLEEAHFVISRSGASSVWELVVSGKPSILVPLPYAEDQPDNAKFLANNNAAIILEQPNFTVANLKKHIKTLTSDSKMLQTMSNNAKDLAILDAPEKLAKAVKEVIKGK